MTSTVIAILEAEPGRTAAMTAALERELPGREVTEYPFALTAAVPGGESRSITCETSSAELCPPVSFP